jgi:excinuclease ABC subunit C
VTNYTEKLKEVPKQPGVYRFLNKNGEVIYVGKAKILKTRLSQYFSGHDDRDQIPYLLEEATDFDYTVVNTELESLFLENTLIKKYLPKYNIMLRDDKNYAFITIDYNYEIPKIGYSRKFADDSHSKIENLKSKIKYFGPYSAAYKIRNTLNLIRRIFPYCSSQEVGARPCFYYYLHRCPGVCIGKISLEEYKQQLEKISWFLLGNTGKIKKELEAEMKTASGKKLFEKAARLRDQLLSLKLLNEKQSVILNKKVDWDVVSLFSDQGYTAINLFKVREGKLFDKENFMYELTSLNPSYDKEGNGPIPLLSEERPGEVMQKFLEQYYLEASDIPKSIYTQYEAEDSELVGHIVKSRFAKKVEVISPKKGKALGLVKLGVTNAEEYLNKWLRDQAGHLDKINNALAELKEVLNLEKTPERIECYDISNTQGTNPVGSMVVFEKGLPKKSEYRKFKIRKNPPAGGPDDFAMMREMLSRRMARSNQQIGKSTNQKSVWPLPDLIVIDGGKGQLGVAIETINDSRLTINVIGLAKRIEEIFIPGKPDPILLSKDSPALQLLQRLRDEAHRFGITFHRDLRSKQAVKSALDDIPGIGPKTKKLLKQKFGTVSQIKKATLQELAKVVGERIAQSIKLSI